MNRSDKVFSELRKKNEGVLVPYLPLYDQSSKSMEIADAYVSGGADALEIPVPSVCPWIDGATLHRYHLSGVRDGVSIENSLEFAKSVTDKYPDIPLWLIFYMSEVLGRDPKELAREIAEAGIDIVDAPNYPIDDPLGLESALEDKNIHILRPIDDEIARVAKDNPRYELLSNIVGGARGALFLMSAPGGLAGERKEFRTNELREAMSNLDKLRKELKNDVPIVIVTGISTPDHIRSAIKEVGAEGVMVGSTFVKKIQAGKSMKELEEFTRNMKNATVRK